MATKSVPHGYHSVTPYLIIDGAARAIEFYKSCFGAAEIMRMPTQDGKIVHAEIRIGDSHVMLADEQPDMGYRGPLSIGGAPVSLMVYVDDVDKTFRQALAAGAKEIRAVANQFYGDRTGIFQDPFGHVWSVATHIEDVSPEELERRSREWMQKSAGA